MTIYMFISAILMVLLIGFLLLITLGVVNTIYTISVSYKASEGKYYDYPMPFATSYRIYE